MEKFERILKNEASQEYIRYQVIGNRLEGQDRSSSFSNVNYTEIGIAAVASAAS
jgi:hypothetical protein